MTNPVIPKSRQLNVWRWSDCPELNNFLGELGAEIESREIRVRARGAKDAKRFRDAFRTLILDLYVAWKTDPDLQIAVPLRANEFTGESRYDALFLNYKPFRAAVEGLEKLGYLTVDKRGYYDRSKGEGHRTRIRATPMLVAKLVGDSGVGLPHIIQNPSKELIQLKNANKNLIEYQDTLAIDSMRQRLQRINDVLSRHWFDLWLPDDELRELNAKLAHDRDRNIIDFTARQLYRVFNDSSFDSGGRFYGGWWQNIPRGYRRLIMIDGSMTVELDYSGIHANILYSLEGLSLLGDPFHKVGFPKEHRQLVKDAFYGLVNTNKDKGLKTSQAFKGADLGISWEDFLRKIMDTHSPLRKHFMTGFGVKLMKIESDIAERVMLHFAEKDIPCIPVHDSFLIQHQHETELRQVMGQAYKEVVGQRIDISGKDSDVLKATRSDTASYGEKKAEYDKMFGDLDKYNGFYGRLRNWRNSQSKRITW